MYGLNMEKGTIVIKITWRFNLSLSEGLNLLLNANDRAFEGSKTVGLTDISSS